MAGIKVTIYNPKRTGVEVIETNATNWGELKNELVSKYGSTILEMTAKAVTSKGQTMNLLDETSFTGPEWDTFTLYLSPSKVANGRF